MAKVPLWNDEVKTCPNCGYAYKLGRDPFSHSEDRIILLSRKVKDGTVMKLWECTACNTKHITEEHPDDESYTVVNGQTYKPFDW